MGKPLVSLTDICQPCVIQEDFLKNERSNLEYGESRKRAYKQLICPEKEQALCCVLFKAVPERLFSKQQMLYSIKAERQKKMQGTTQCLASLAKEQRQTQRSVYKTTGCNLRKTKTTARLLMTALGLWPHYSGHRPSSRRRICPLGPATYKAS